MCPLSQHRNSSRKQSGEYRTPDHCNIIYFKISLWHSICSETSSLPLCQLQFAEFWRSPCYFCLYVCPTCMDHRVPSKRTEIKSDVINVVYCVLRVRTGIPSRNFLHRISRLIQHLVVSINVLCFALLIILCVIILYLSARMTVSTIRRWHWKKKRKLNWVSFFFQTLQKLPVLKVYYWICRWHLFINGWKSFWFSDVLTSSEMWWKDMSEWSGSYGDVHRHFHWCIHSWR